MEMRIPLWALAAVMLVSLQQNTRAQEPDKKTEAAKETLEKGIAIIGGIFKKKGKENTGEGTVKTTSPKDVEGTDQGTPGPRPGEVHPDAVVIDADAMGPFNKGAAIIRKGRSQSLINAKGDFIFPYNTYQYMDVLTENMDGTGLFKAHDPMALHKGVIVNEKGTVLADPLSDSYKTFFKSGPFLELKDIRDTKSRKFFNIKGEQIASLTNVAVSMECYRDGLVPYSGPEVRKGNKRYQIKGYKNLKDQVVIPANWEEVECFRDGAAIVGNTDEFGAMKYGFIDTSGKLIVPLMFSRKPESFSDGYAKVYPRDIYSKGYGYLDKTGTLRIENPQGLYGDFHEGYAFSNTRVMDKKGTVISAREFLIQMGLPADVPKENEGINWRLDKLHKGKLLVTFKGAAEHRWKHYYALIDIVQKKTHFYWHVDAKVLDFDFASGLAHVIIYGEKTRSHIQREGYINEQGVFMIIKGEKSKW
jgi:hypothetical protein